MKKTGKSGVVRQNRAAVEAVVSLWKMIERSSLTGKLRMLRQSLERAREDEGMRQGKARERVITTAQPGLCPDRAR